MNTVLAGHSDVFIPSDWNRPTYINLLDPVSLQTEVSIEPQSICKGAITWARWDGGTFDMPLDEPEEAFSIFISGTCIDSSDVERAFVLSTSVPAEKIHPPSISEDDGTFDTLNFTVVVDTSELLHKIECSDDMSENSSSLLQALLNVQNNALWTWEWE